MCARVCVCWREGAAAPAPGGSSDGGRRGKRSGATRWITAVLLPAPRASALRRTRAWLKGRGAAARWGPRRICARARALAPPSSAALPGSLRRRCRARPSGRGDDDEGAGGRAACRAAAPRLPPRQAAASCAAAHADRCRAGRGCGGIWAGYARAQPPPLQPAAVSAPSRARSRGPSTPTPTSARRCREQGRLRRRAATATQRQQQRFSAAAPAPAVAPAAAASPPRVSSRRCRRGG